MRICDACKNEPVTPEPILVKFDVHDCSLDFCKDYMKYVNVNSLLIGINEVRKHEVKK